jgi:hypothetical protein
LPQIARNVFVGLFTIYTSTVRLLQSAEAWRGSE